MLRSTPDKENYICGRRAAQARSRDLIGYNEHVCGSPFSNLSARFLGGSFFSETIAIFLSDSRESGSTLSRGESSGPSSPSTVSSSNPARSPSEPPSVSRQFTQPNLRLQDRDSFDPKRLRNCHLCRAIEEQINSVHQERKTNWNTTGGPPILKRERDLRLRRWCVVQNGLCQYQQSVHPECSASFFF